MVPHSLFCISVLTTGQDESTDLHIPGGGGHSQPEIPPQHDLLSLYGTHFLRGLKINPLYMNIRQELNYLEN